ncbi:MAG: insulinase family protein [Acidobacteria bacterium]|nr:insulinase family protein [Acidobacteriota bacterium]
MVSVEGITEYALSNGLRVLLFPDQTKPTITVNITYFVGSRHEGYGESGMAHLLEHMVFKGTPTHENIWALLEDHGASFNGTTWVDRTNYYEILPASDGNLEFALRLEADRMVNCKIAREDLQKEFSVVRNEFEMGENNPLMVLEERMYSSAYLWHNYGKATIGSRSDIERVPIESLRAFYERFYQPDNAMLVVAGKFEPAMVLRLIEEHFGTIPRPGRALMSTYTTEPVQDGERTVVLRRAGDVAAVGVMYHGLPGAHEDFAAEQAIVDILTNEPAGRLYKSLVETGVAARITGSAYAWAEPGMLQCFAEVRLDSPIDPVRDRMVAVIEELGRGGIRQDEVDRFKARALKEINLGMNDSQRLGVELSEWAAIGDWRMIFIHRDRVRALTLDRVQRVAAAFLKPSNRTVGIFLPTSSPDRSPLPELPDIAGLAREYKGDEAARQGEAFVSTIENIEKKVMRTDLSNGMKLALLPKKTRGGAVHGVLTVHFGNERDLVGKTVAMSLIPAMLVRGSTDRTYQQIRDELDRLQAQVSFMAANTSAATVRITTVRQTILEVLALVAQLLQRPAFMADQFEIEKKETLAGLEQRLQDPMALGFLHLYRAIDPWPSDNVRYQPTIQEKIAAISSAHVDQIRELHGRFYGGSKAELTLVGDFDPEETRVRLDKLFGDWCSHVPFLRISKIFQSGIPGSDAMVRTPDKQMAMVGVGQNMAVRDDEPDYAALEMLNYLLGSSAKSRLLNRLRQKEGLSYSAFSNIIADPVDRYATFFAGAICAPANASRSMDLILEELRRVIDEGIPAAELEESKNSYQQGFDNQLAQDENVMSMLNASLYYDRSLEHFSRLNARIRDLAPGDIARAAATHLNLDRLIRVKAGDLSG